MKKILFIFLFSISFFITSCTKDSTRLQEAMASFQLEPGMRIELVAAEPLVVDPVALAFDENRRMYVIENRGYPDPAEGGSSTKLGRVALMEDKDGDGIYDHRSEFATGLTYPNGVVPWKGGVFVTCAPDIFYFKDTNGDGIADVKRVVLTGFNDTKTAQIRISHPTLGIDGWIYITGGLNGGNVSSPEHPDRPKVSYTSADGRFNPETFEFEAIGGKSQFGLTFDSYGRRFGCSNRHPVMQTVLEPWYLQRNSHLMFTETVENVSKVEAEATVFPLTKGATSHDFFPKRIGRSHAGTFTAASGVTVFNGTGLTPAHQGNIFICESAQNMIQRQVIHSKGVSFRSELVYEGREFLSSTDEWFRPVFLQHGPEGALYVADIHRKVIDHPSYFPEEARGNLDFESGKNDGRIYRIVREEFREGKSDDHANLNSSASTAEIVRALESSEEWERATAHRLLLERKDMVSIPLLRKCAVESTFPESRARALWLLHSLGSLDAATVKKALLDKEGGVREQAVLLTETLCEEHPELVQAVITAATDAEVRVRFNSALVLGSLEGPQVVEALAKIAARDGADRWVRAAVLSGLEKRTPAFLTAFREQQMTESLAFSVVMQDLGRLFGNGGSLKDCSMLLQDVISSQNDDEWRVSTVLGLAEGLSGRTKEFGTSPEGLLYAIQENNNSTVNRASLDKFITKVMARADDEEEQVNLRIVATGLLGYTNFERTRTVLRDLLDARHPPELQIEAVGALTRQGDVRGGALLTAKKTWSSYTPRVRSAVIAALVSKPEFINVLFEAIEQDVIAITDISSADRERLMKQKDDGISARAEDLFKELEEGGRMQVYQDYRQILEEPADAVLGKAVFSRACSACHTYAGEGSEVGPDLAGVRNQPADALLLHILVPNYEVYSTYQSISVGTSDGRSLSGRLIAETENSLTLRTAFGTDESILRTNITSLTNTGRSLMPDGLEQSMTEDELAQLIAYLKSGG